MVYEVGGDVLQVVAFAVFVVGTAVLAAIDARTMLLPNRVLYPVAWSGLGLLAAAAGVSGSWARLVTALLSGAVAVAVFFLVHRTSELGLGDVRLAGLIGFFLGWFGPGAVLAGLGLGVGLGALVGAVLLAARKVGRRSMLPYGPFLVAGAWIALLRAAV